MNVSVCLYVRSHISKTVIKTTFQTSPNFLQMLYMTVTRFCSDEYVTRYVLPDLWITGRLVTPRGGNALFRCRQYESSSYVVHDDVIIITSPQSNLRRAASQRPHWLQWDVPNSPPKTAPFPSTITTPSNTPIPRPTPVTTKQHPDPISRFATIHFADRQTDRQTDGPGESSVP